AAGSCFQGPKCLARRGYAWFNGWMYLFAGILTVTAVVATIPIALIPTIDGLPSLVGAKEWTIQPTLGTSLVVALITLVVITVLNIYGVRLVAIVNNTAVIFEMLVMFVCALILAILHNHQ